MLVIILSTLISVFGVLFTIFHLFGNRELYNKTEHINGRKVFPLIGNSYQFIGDSANFLKQMIRSSKIYSSPFKIVFASRVCICSTDPEQIKIILQSPKTAEKNFPYNFAKDWVGDGLVTAKNSIWREHRKMIQPAFKQKLFKSFVSILQKNSLLMTQELKDKLGGPEFKITPYAASTSVNNICEIFMGVSVETRRKDVEEFYKINHQVFTILYGRLIRIWLHWDFLFKFSQLSREFYKCIKYLHGFIDKIIEKRRKNLDTTSASNEGNVKPILDSLIEESGNGMKFNNKELRDHIITIVTAGFDTSSRTMEFVLFMLAQYPKIQDKVYNELFNIYGTEDPEANPVKYEDLHKFVYMEQVIKETLRLFPVAPAMTREVTEDIDIGGCIVPKGVTAVVCPFLVHRNEKVWHDALKFDPDRFLSENSINRHPCAFIPFSYGNRDCIGRTFAMIMIKVVVAIILRKYTLRKKTFTEPKDIKLKADSLLFSAEPITIQIERRVN